MSKEKGRVIPDYPPEREDWLHVEFLAQRNSPLGCLLCDKTHFRKDCEHLARRAEILKELNKSSPSETYKSQYSYYGD